MNKLDIVHLLKEKVEEEFLDCPKIEQELQQILNFLKLLFLDEINLAKNLDWPGWAEPKGELNEGWLRRLLYRAFEGKCFWTGKRLKFKDMEIDHVIPKSLGGADNYLNFVPCLMRYNRTKNNSLKLNRKLVATLYYVESVYEKKVKEELQLFRDSANKRKEKAKARRAADRVNREHELRKIGKDPFYFDFWNEEKINNRLKRTQDKVQAFFQTFKPILYYNQIWLKLEDSNVDLANLSRYSKRNIIWKWGFKYDSGDHKPPVLKNDYRKVVVDALWEVGIREGKEKLSVDELREMDILRLRTFFKLTHLDKFDERKAYSYWANDKDYKTLDLGLEKELAKVMNQLAKYLKSVTPC